jgi:hypothetical protein
LAKYSPERSLCEGKSPEFGDGSSVFVGNERHVTNKESMSSQIGGSCLGDIVRYLKKGVGSTSEADFANKMSVPLARIDFGRERYG